MKYKVGDKVKIRSWNSMVKEFGSFVDSDGEDCIETKNGIWFREDMREFCCREFVVKKVVEIDAVAQGYELHDAGGYLYSDDMLESGDSPCENEKAKIHANICRYLTELYKRKNEDYGDSFAKSYTEYGAAMPCIRLDDKLSRFKKLTLSGKQKVNDESAIDTLVDLANYAVMTLIEMGFTGGD